MDVEEALTRLGGCASRRALIGASSRAEFASALSSGLLVRAGRGRYVHAGADDALRAASRLSGVMSHWSAALHWGWAVKNPPTEPASGPMTYAAW